MDPQPHHEIESDELDCAACGHDRVVVAPDGDVECPNCNHTYSLVVRDGFTLLESDGWIARVTFGLDVELPGVVPG